MMGLGAGRGGRELSYAEITADFGTAATADIPGLSCTFTATGRPVLVCMFGALVTHSVALKSVQPAIFEGVNQLVMGKVFSALAGAGGPLWLSRRLVPTAGAHTYKGQLRFVDAGTMTIFAGPTYPAYLQVLEL